MEQNKYQEALEFVDEALERTSCGWFDKLELRTSGWKNMETGYNYPTKIRINGCYIAYILGRYNKALEYDSDHMCDQVLCYIKLGKVAPRSVLEYTCRFARDLHGIAFGSKQFFVNSTTEISGKCRICAIKYFYAKNDQAGAKRAFERTVSKSTKRLLLDAIAEYNAGDFKQANAYLGWIQEQRTGLTQSDISVLNYYLGLCNIKSNNLRLAYNLLVESLHGCFNYDLVRAAIKVCKGRLFRFEKASVYYDTYLLL
jgi:hypothetical protein